MQRRRLLESALLAGAAAVGAVRSARAAEGSGRRWILPTDTPDRFGLKVMEWNPIPVPDLTRWELRIEGLARRPVRLKLADLERLPRAGQSSRLKCVQCWSGRVRWEGFRCRELLELAEPEPAAAFVRFDCADRYYDYVSFEDLRHPRSLFALAMNGEPLTPEHGAPLRLVLPFKYGYRWSKLITRLTLTDKGGQGVVADASPYYSPNGDILPGLDHPFDFPGEVRKIKGGEIVEY